MKPLLLSFLLTLAACHSFAKEPVIPGDFDNFFLDALGNFYTTKENVIVRYNIQGEETARYSSLMYGNVSWLDVSGSFKILVFYKDFEMLLFLDNNLSPSSQTFSPEDNGPFSPLLVCRSREDGIWILDQISGSIIRLDNHMQVQAKSNPIPQLPGESQHFMIQQGDQIFIHTDSLVLVFDPFANYQTTLHFPENSLITWSSIGITALYGDTLTLYNYENHSRKTIPWAHKNTIAIRHERNRIYYLTPKGIFSAKMDGL